MNTIIEDVRTPTNPRSRRSDHRPVTVILGAGPYGLSIAAHLRAQDVPVRVFGEPMAGWRHHMPSGMFLKSAPTASSLSAPAPGFTLNDFCAATGSPVLGDHQPVPIELFERYGLWFQERLVPMVERSRVRQLCRAGERFELRLESGEEVRAETVVVASGVASFAHLPAELSKAAGGGQGRSGPVSHTSQHRDLSVFAGREVAVIGGGQSGLESAALLHEKGARVTLIVRKPQLVFASPPGNETRGRRLVKPPSPMGPGWSLFSFSRGPGLFRYLPDRTRLELVRSVLGPSGAWWLRERVDGRIDVRTEHWVRAACLSDRRVILHLNAANRRSSELAVDHVMAATGYRVDLGALSFLDPGLRAELRCVGGSPALAPDFETSVPGLFFAGLTAAATFGPMLRFVCGADFAARRVSTAVAKRVAHQAWV